MTRTLRDEHRDRLTSALEAAVLALTEAEAAATAWATDRLLVEDARLDDRDLFLRSAIRSARKVVEDIYVP